VPVHLSLVMLFPLTNNKLLHSPVSPLPTIIKIAGFSMLPWSIHNAITAMRRGWMSTVKMINPSMTFCRRVISKVI
jgi:hypothetical protein